MRRRVTNRFFFFFFFFFFFLFFFFLILLLFLFSISFSFFFLFLFLFLFFFLSLYLLLLLLISLLLLLLLICLFLFTKQTTAKQSKLRQTDKQVPHMDVRCLLQVAAGDFCKQDKGGAIRTAGATISVSRLPSRREMS